MSSQVRQLMTDIDVVRIHLSRTGIINFYNSNNMFGPTAIVHSALGTEAPKI